MHAPRFVFHSENNDTEDGNVSYDAEESNRVAHCNIKLN